MEKILKSNYLYILGAIAALAAVVFYLKKISKVTDVATDGAKSILEGLFGMREKNPVDETKLSKSKPYYRDLADRIEKEFGKRYTKPKDVTAESKAILIEIDALRNIEDIKELDNAYGDRLYIGWSIAYYNFRGIILLKGSDFEKNYLNKALKEVGY